MHNMTIIHSGGDLCNYDIAKLPTYRVAEGLTISYPNFLKLYISRGFILLSTLARIFAQLDLMRKKSRSFSMEQQ